MNDVKSFFFVNINELLSLPQKGSFVITQKKRNASIRYECEFKLIEQFFLDIQSPLSLSVIETIVYYSQRIYLSFTINPKISFHWWKVTTFISLSLENSFSTITRFDFARIIFYNCIMYKGLPISVDYLSTQTYIFRKWLNHK